ncbi:glycerate dehydrogenase [Pseudomonas sp. URIL14HWK12:I8]|uniref:D-2-hydroxyacid dehydrogenase n=1 Tax=unclassified Pseudomonas TaxID=196821 RepID=UPI000482EB8C|nr:MULTISPECIES: D-2-hydroxyacid dehydrogenase [unclassified Pseudomonas]SNB62823.1 glycerate dehydrogenase [Pseudomonas sp. URIL14HWK12:I8]
MNIVFLDGASLPCAMKRPAEAFQWTVRESTSPEELVSVLAEAEVAITNKVKLGRAQLEQLPKLQLICVAATGFDCVDIAACRDLGVTVCNAPAYSASSVAEAVIASIFALRRSLFEYREAASKRWPTSNHFCVHGTPIQDINGSTLGIVGWGGIGSRVAQLAVGLDMHVIFAEHRGAPRVREGYVPFETMLQEADAISLHCPLTPQTRHLIGAEQLSLMKQGALLINTARGPLVDEQAVLSALRSGHLGGAALDVLDVEPPQADHPLLTADLPNLIVTPHVGWASQSSVARLIDTLLSNITAYASGKAINVVS